tara:strand:+ start:37252 stop:37893 length:642 start_codon:yes stop_codon:yes gene_type:complete
MTIPPVYRRHSLLKRNAGLTRSQFSAHYEGFHGPLAANLAGFRKFATTYLQNHVEPSSDAQDTPFDGVTMTTQTPRHDYTRGFFNDPDYEKVKADELYLFDIGTTVSVLGREDLAKEGPRTRWKALLLGSGSPDLPATAGRVVLNHLDVNTASALGFGGSAFDFEYLAELWFESESDRATSVETADPGHVVLPVREITIYSPDKPWNAANSEE